MKSPEKNTEGALQTIFRTAITAAIIAAILTFTHVFAVSAMSAPALLGVIWLMVYCIVYGGHWLEVLFINQIKFMLPPNKAVIYFSRIVYWFLNGIPLFMLANWVGNAFTNHDLNLGRWWTFGLAYIAIELFMHLIMQLRYRKSYYNGVY